MLVCPILETFDQWDHTVQTGNDTECTLVVLGLCVGVAYTLARLVFRFSLTKSLVELISNLCAHISFTSGKRGSFFVIPIPLSPSVLGLRI